MFFLIPPTYTLFVYTSTKNRNISILTACWKKIFRGKTCQFGSKETQKKSEAWRSSETCTRSERLLQVVNHQRQYQQHPAPSDLKDLCQLQFQRANEALVKPKSQNQNLFLVLKSLWTSIERRRERRWNNRVSWLHWILKNLSKGVRLKVVIVFPNGKVETRSSFDDGILHRQSCTCKPGGSCKYGF